MKKLNFLLLFFLFVASFAFAQNSVEGIVKSSNGEPLSGASVIEKGTSNGTVTDFNGNYKMNVEKGKSLVFSYIGFLTKEIKVATNTVDVTLEDDGEELDEIQIVGSRSVKRSVIDTPVPVDVINVSELSTKNART